MAALQIPTTTTTTTTTTNALIRTVAFCAKHSTQRNVRHTTISSRWFAIDTMTDENTWLTKAKNLVPKLTHDRHKGEAGRIGIIGGSHEYTGAPYFSAISALKVGADLVHVFCVKDAATVIKSYSPDLIVHPVLDAPNAVEIIEPWLQRLHAVVLGPGLGRDDTVLANAASVVAVLKRMNKPLVVDADGLFLVTQRPELIKDYRRLVLTPNRVEYARLLDVAAKNDTHATVLALNDEATIVCKGPADEIFNKHLRIECRASGSGRRCGGQGDLLSGALGTFYGWANAQQDNDAGELTMAACYAACRLVRECNLYTFNKLGRSMVSNDMVGELGKVFNNLYELKD